MKFDNELTSVDEPTGVTSVCSTEGIPRATMAALDNETADTETVGVVEEVANEGPEQKQTQVDIQVQNALRILASRHSYLSKHDNEIKSISTYSPEEGKVYDTKERAIPDVVPPANYIPTDEKLFDANGVPDYKFLMQHYKRQGKISEEQMIRIIDMASDIMRDESNLLEIDVPATVVGDIHGQYYDLLGLLELYGDPKDTQYLFLGDYVDRGDRSIEVLTLLYAIKINFPKTFWLMRGNHESSRMTSYFTYKKECMTRFSIKLYEKSIDSFKTLPLCAVLNKQFFCVHAGISSSLWNLDDIKSIDRDVADFPSSGLFCDLMWSDPSAEYDTDDIGVNEVEQYFKRNTDRHCSEFYSYRATESFLNNNNLLSVIRGHQPQDSGYRIYKMNETTHFPSLITIFSAPNYCGTYGNMAAVLHYNGETFNIKQFDSFPTPYFLPDQMNVFEWSLPFVAEKVVEILSALLNVCTDDELVADTVVFSDRIQENVERHYKNKALALQAQEAESGVETYPGTAGDVDEPITTSSKIDDLDDYDVGEIETGSDQDLSTETGSDTEDTTSGSESGDMEVGAASIDELLSEESDAALSDAALSVDAQTLAADRSDVSSEVTDQEVSANETDIAVDDEADAETQITVIDPKPISSQTQTQTPDSASKTMVTAESYKNTKTTDNKTKKKVKADSRVDANTDPDSKTRGKSKSKKKKRSSRILPHTGVSRIPHHLNKIQRKVGVGKRMSQLLGVLREERERVEEFTHNANRDFLPAQVLLDGREALASKLHGFSEARDLDKPNEGLPPSEWKC